MISEIKVGSVLSMENASSILINNCSMAGHSPSYSQSLHIVMNLDNKYSKLQVYNKKIKIQTHQDIANKNYEEINEFK